MVQSRRGRRIFQNVDVQVPHDNSREVTVVNVVEIIGYFSSKSVERASRRPISDNQLKRETFPEIDIQVEQFKAIVHQSIFDGNVELLLMNN